MSANSETIVYLSNLYYEVIRIDHHKSRDCHWFIEVDYAYGKPPVFRARHAGYRFEYIDGVDRDTYLEAELDLINYLRRALKEQRDWALRVLKDTEEQDFSEEAVEILSILGKDNVVFPEDKP